MASLDDVFNLLTAVNQTTLGRMEGEIKDTKSLLDAVNGTTLGRMEGEMVQPHSMVDNSLSLLRTPFGLIFPSFDSPERVLHSVDPRTCLVFTFTKPHPALSQASVGTAGRHGLSPLPVA